jgi:O-antigen/teichoic acid export membrane protein
MTGGRQEPITNRDVARGLGTTMLARMGALIDVVSQPIFVWLFGLASFGLYAVLWSAVNLIENVADLGMTSSLQRIVPQARSEREAVAALRAALVMGVAPCLLIAALASLLAPEVAPLFNVAAADQAGLVSAIRLFAWALPLWALVEVATSALRARRLFGAEIRLRIFWEQLIRLPLAAIFYLAGFGIMGLFLAHLISLGIIGLLAVRLLARNYDLRHMIQPIRIDGTVRETFGAGLSILPSNIVAQLYSNAPPVVLNALLPGAAGATSAALYTIVRKLSSIVQIVRSAFVYVLSPLTSAAAHGGREEIRALYSYACRIAVALVMPLGCTMIAGSNILLDLFGNGADTALIALIALTGARMMEALAGLSSSVLQVIGGYSERLLASFVGLGTALAIGALIGIGSGVNGAALAVAAGLVTGAIITQWQLLSRQHIHPFHSGFAAVAARATLISAVAAALAIAANFAPPILRPPLLIAICAAAVWLSARFALAEADRRSLGKTGRRLRLIQ